MHIPDGFISGPINAATGVAAAASVGLSAWRASREVGRRPHTVPLLATTGAFVFAAQMLNFPIGGGTSGHFMGAAAVAALLGPWSACLVMSLTLVIQCLGFADGGLTALGTNILNMGILGGFVSYAVMRGLRSVLPAGRGGYLTAVALASWISLVVAASACALELAISGTSPLRLVLPAMAGTHAVIGIGEAVITSAVISAVVAARPDILPEWAGVESGRLAPRVAASAHGASGPRSASEAGASTTPARTGTWTLAGFGLAVTILLAIFASPLASVSPDGLEKVAQEKGFLQWADGQSLWRSSPLPNYAVPGVESGGFSTGLSGLAGAAAVFAVGFGIIKLLALRPRQ